MLGNSLFSKRKFNNDAISASFNGSIVISENASMCLKAVTTTADITISKGVVETPKVYTKTYLYNTKYEDNLIDLTMFTPKDAGNKTFFITDKTYTGIDTVSSAVIDGNNLKFTVDKMDEFEDNISTKISIKISSDNYSDYIQEIVIKRISCEHPENKIELKHNKLPECETAGEDSRVCSNCGEIVEAGIVVPALGHDYHDGICTREGCGVVSFELEGGREAAEKFMKSLKLAAIETHVADARTCCLNPATSTHRQMNDEQLEAAGIPAGLIRISCGLEDKADLIADLSQALDAI